MEVQSPFPRERTAVQRLAETRALEKILTSILRTNDLPRNVFTTDFWFEIVGYGNCFSNDEELRGSKSIAEFCAVCKANCGEGKCPFVLLWEAKDTMELEEARKGFRRVSDWTPLEKYTVEADALLKTDEIQDFVKSVWAVVVANMEE